MCPRVSESVRLWLRLWLVREWDARNLNGMDTRRRWGRVCAEIYWIAKWMIDERANHICVIKWALENRSAIFINGIEKAGCVFPHSTVRDAMIGKENPWPGRIVTFSLGRIGKREREALSNGHGHASQFQSNILLDTRLWRRVAMRARLYVCVRLPCFLSSLLYCFALQPQRNALLFIQRSHFGMVIGVWSTSTRAPLLLPLRTRNHALHGRSAWRWQRRVLIQVAHGRWAVCKIKESNAHKLLIAQDVKDRLRALAFST